MAGDMNPYAFAIFGILAIFLTILSAKGLHSLIFVLMSRTENSSPPYLPTISIDLTFLKLFYSLLQEHSHRISDHMYH